MLRFFSFAMMAALVSLTWAASPATTRKAPAKKTAAKTPSKATSRTTGKSTSRTAAKKGGKRAPVRKATTWRNRQMAPTPARYREIQEALAAKGYLRPEDATGSWTQNSMDALKRFQTDQNIESNGKINSLSLIALGLGPKREAVVIPPAPPAADQ